MVNLGLAMVALSLTFGGAKAMEVSSSEPVISSDPIQSSEPVEEQEEVFECSVKEAYYHIDETTGEKVEDKNNKYGNAIFSITEGHVGDEVTLIVAGNPDFSIKSQNLYFYKYLVKYVSVNGTEIKPNSSSNNTYSFTLVDGVNIVEIGFSGKMELRTLDLKDTNWKALFTFDNLMKIIELVGLAFTTSGLCFAVVKAVGTKKKTKEEDKKEYEIAWEENTNKFLNDIVAPIISAQNDTNKKNLEAINSLARISLLSQEGTPEAKLAMINELQKYVPSDEELAEKVKAIVNANKEKEEAEKAEKQRLLEEAQAKIDNLEEVEVDTPDASKVGDRYGSIL